MEQKREYETPQLKDWGTVVDLTKLGGSDGPGDTFNDIVHESGSVVPNTGRS